MRSKKILIASAAVGALALAGCSAGTGADTGFDQSSASGDFDWKRYDGSTINVMLSEHPWTDGVKERLSEFEELTGIKVNLQSYTETLYLDKMAQSLRSAESPDVYMLYADDAVVNQYAANLVEPLTPYLDNPALTDDEFDVADFAEGTISGGMLPAGEDDAELYYLPIATETYILYYNKDIVDDYLDGDVPQTMEELIEASEKITAEGDGDVFGSVMRGVRSDSIKDTLTGFVLNDIPRDESTPLPYNIWFDGGWDSPRLDDPNIAAGLANYAALLNQGPSNRLNLDWPDAVSLFSQGKVGFFIDSTAFGPGFEDPEVSQVAGKTGYAAIPATDANGTSGTWSWAVAISANAKNKGPAWLFTQWATGKEISAEVGVLTGGSPRQSSYEDPTYTESFNAEYLEVMTDSLAEARPVAVLNDNWKPGALVIIDAMLAIANGTSPEEATTAANEEMKQTIQ